MSAYARLLSTHADSLFYFVFRIKDPSKSVDFYKNKLGMTLIDKYEFPKWDFSLYFLASLKPGEKYSLVPGTPEAHKFLWETDKVTLELTHNWVRESVTN